MYLYVFYAQLFYETALKARIGTGKEYITQTEIGQALEDMYVGHNVD